MRKEKDQVCDYIEQSKESARMAEGGLMAALGATRRMTMEKPDWGTAPEWASYLTYDCCGWWWHEEMPEPEFMDDGSGNIDGFRSRGRMIAAHYVAAPLIFKRPE